MIVSYSILGGVKTIGIVARILLKLNRFDDFGFLGYVTAENRSVPRAIRGLIVSPSKQLSRNTHTHNYEKLQYVDLSSWRIYGGGNAMFVSARIVFSRENTVEMVVGVEGEELDQAWNR